MDHVHLIGQLFVWAVVSVVPAYFVFLFASSSYRELKKRHARWVQAEQAFAAAPLPKPPELQTQLVAAQEAFAQCRRTVWGAFWGVVCRLPPAARFEP
jgi:hypothetical protein